MIVNKIDKISTDDANFFLRVNGRRFCVSMNAISLRLARAQPQQQSSVRVSANGHMIKWPLIDLEMPVSSLIQMGKPYWGGI